MKLRLRVERQSRALELDGADPTLSELRARVRGVLGSDVDFTLSLNGKDVLVDTGQCLSSCGVVSGDMIRVVLPQDGSRGTLSARMEAGGSSVTDTGMEAWLEQEEECVTVAPPPLLCCETEEGVIPHTLERLLHTATCSNQSDGLMLAVHLLLLETGFLPQGCGVNSGEMPIGWRAAGGVYRLQYTHPLLEKSLVSVVAVPMGQTLVTNAVLKTDAAVERSHKLVLRPDVYVSLECTDGCVDVGYRDLRRLSRVFKDQLVYPLMATARQALGLPDLFGLPVLPPELLLRVLRLLDVASLLSLSAVCRELNVATLDPSLWRHLLHRDFRVSLCAGAPAQDWKQLYKEQYKRRKEVGRCRFYPPHMPPIHPFSPTPVPLPLYPPGIIGGDYDQVPVILPRPRFDPIGPIPGHLPGTSVPIARRGARAADIRRGFI